MKIKLALLEKDSNYLNRITAVFGVRFADKVEVLAYTDEKSAVAALKAAKVNVFLASEDFDIEPTSLPDKCCFAYFVEDSAVKEIRGQRAICKFQQIDNIYKQILDIYAEKFQGVIGFNGDAKTTIWWFCSPGGGSGASSVAAATAVHFAKKQKKVLFVELDEFGNAEQYFQGGGQATFNELIMAIKGKKKNLSMKLESNVRTDIKTGVDFFSAPSLALDINEFTADDMEVLIQEIIKLGLYDIVVIDRKLSLIGGVCQKLWKNAKHVIMVTNGKTDGNYLAERALKSMEIMSEQLDDLWMEKIILLQNKKGVDDKSVINYPGVSEIGTIPYYNYSSTDQLIQTISMLALFDKI